MLSHLHGPIGGLPVSTMGETAVIQLSFPIKLIRRFQTLPFVFDRKWFVSARRWPRPKQIREFPSMRRMDKPPGRKQVLK